MVNTPGPSDNSRWTNELPLASANGLNAQSEKGLKPMAIDYWTETRAMKIIGDKDKAMLKSWFISWGSNRFFISYYLVNIAP